MTSYVKDHKPQEETPTMRVSPVQKTNVRWTWGPLDICSSLYPPHFRKANTRRIHLDLNKLIHLFG